MHFKPYFEAKILKVDLLDYNRPMFKSSNE